ncbi:MAG: peptide deformylase [Candidatus Kapabacteria bacterium]|nr:peptide deformylase [Candidatus Kapabacteria bacterium]
MSIIPVYNCFHPVLKKKTEPVTEIDDGLVKLVDDMFDTMHKAEGIGLAANQIGVSKSLVVIDIGYYNEKYKGPPLTMINPVIEYFSDDIYEYEEGCLSIPSVRDVVERPKIVQVSFYDLNMKEHKIEADNLLSRVIQHEIDHLNGILFYERLTPLRKTLLKGKLKKIEKGQYQADYPMILPDGTFLPANKKS